MSESPASISGLLKKIFDFHSYTYMDKIILSKMVGYSFDRITLSFGLGLTQYYVYLQTITISNINKGTMTNEKFANFISPTNRSSM